MVSKSKSEKSVTVALLRAARAHRVALESALSDVGLYAGQDTLLQNLLEEDGQTITGLARKLGVKAPTVTKMVNRMSAAGLLRKEGSADDARRSHVFMTEEGRSAASVIDKVWKQAEKEALKGFSDKDRKSLRKMLQALAANLTGGDGSPQSSKSEAGPTGNGRLAVLA